VVLGVAFVTSAAADSIVNGSPAAPGEYPAQGFLQVDTDGDGLGDSQCGGTLVGNRYFLTAAHCVDDGTGVPFPPTRFLVGLGNVKVSQIADVYDVVSVEENAAFDLGTNGNDTAMLKFSRPAPYTPPRVIGVDDGPQWAAGTSARIVGWGSTSSGGPTSDDLLEADVPIVADGACSASYGTGFDPTTMVCAGDGVHDTCQGDSGGPLMVPDGGELVLAGITSWGIGCADPSYPGVYTRIGAPGINAWIMARFPHVDFTAGLGQSGLPLTLTASAFHPESPGFSALAWDLDNDGRYDDASGPTASRAFPAGGTYRVGLQALKPGLDSAVAHHMVTVNGRPNAEGGGPYRVREGRTILLRGGAVDPEGQPVALAWNLDGNSSFESSGRNRVFSARGRDGPSRRAVGLRACDNAGGCTTDAVTIRILNGRPTAKAGKDRRARAGARLRFAGIATDPGRDRLRYRWSFGDRRAAKGRRVGHRYKRPGRYRVTLTVTDGDGGVARDTATVRVRR
jgi:hypothetical protein